MANSLDMRLRVLEQRGGGSARADGLDALAAWVAEASARLAQSEMLTNDDLWDWVLGDQAVGNGKRP